MIHADFYEHVHAWTKGREAMIPNEGFENKALQNDAVQYTG